MNIIRVDFFVMHVFSSQKPEMNLRPWTLSSLDQFRVDSFWMLSSVRVDLASASWGDACDILELCLDIVSGVSTGNFKDDVFLVQVNRSNESSVWLSVMPSLLPKLKQIQLKRDIQSHQQKQHG